MVRRFFHVLPFLFLLAAAAACRPLLSHASQDKLVLLINSYHKNYAWSDNVVRGVNSVFAGDQDVEVRVEYLDSKRHPMDMVVPPFIQLMKSKYGTLRPRVIIVSDDNAMDLMLDSGKELFPGVPVVFCGISNFKGARLMGRPSYTGVVEDFDLKGTVEIALELHPETRNVAFVSDATETGVQIRRRVDQIRPWFKNRVRFIDLDGLTPEEMAEALRRLPERTVLIYLSYHRDHTGKTFTVAEGVGYILDNTDAPLYGCWDFLLGTGVVGGKITSGFSQGVEAGKMAKDILEGRKVEDIPVMTESPGTFVFDYEALAGHGLSVEDLPAGSKVLNRPDNAFGHWMPLREGAGVLVVVGLSAGLCVWFFVRRHGRLKMKLADSSERYELLVKGANDGFWVWNVGDGLVDFSDRYMDMLGYEPREFASTIEEWTSRIHPDDLEAVMAVNDACREGRVDQFSIEYRLRHKSGDWLWVLGRGAGLKDDRGRVRRMAGAHTDITERKVFERKLTDSLKEKDLLLREVHHRVKNNLQIISSLLNLQAGFVADPADYHLFERSRHRVLAMARIHERLYQAGGLSRIDICEYVELIRDDLFNFYLDDKAMVEWKTVVCDLKLSIDKAIPCGLIMNELITNSLRHAFAGGQGGTLFFSARMLDETTGLIALTDDGAGLADPEDIEGSTTLGFALVNSLVGQLGGEMRCTSVSGTCFEITFPTV